MATLGRTLSVLAAVLAIPAAALAQTATRSFGDLQQALRVGQSVVVTDDTGGRLKGTVAHIDGVSLMLDVRISARDPKGTHTFLAGRIASVTRTDSVANGIFIGMGAGALGAFWFTRGNCGTNDPECAAIAGLVGVAVFVPAGAVAGWLIDRAIKKPMYLAPSRGARPSLNVSPAIGRHAGGVMVSVRF